MLRSLAICLLTMLSLPLFAKQGFRSDAVPLREQCRREISGIYVAYHDEKRRADDFLIQLEEQKLAFDQGLKKAKAEEAKHKKAPHDPYDIDEHRNAKAMSSVIEDLVQRQKENAAMIDRIRIDAKRASQTLSAFEPRLKKVFHVEGLKSDHKGEFPFTLHYRDECPRYQSNCKLMRAAAFDLLGIFAKPDETPESCRRYASMSGVQ
jgi:hypothetical protein